MATCGEIASPDQMSAVIRVHQHGGAEVLSLESETVSPPSAGQVQIRQSHVGVNFIDVYHRTGYYPTTPPFTPGVEGVGVVLAVGDDVATVKAGDRVAYAGGPLGAYCEVRNVPSELVLQVPDDVDDAEMAGGLLRGMTAQILLKRVYRVTAGDNILVHAAAGGMGLLLCQWAKALGATVIGTVSTPAKAELARKFGCESPIVTEGGGVADRVRAQTAGKGVAVVYDAIGKDTFEDSINCLTRRGHLVSYGQSSGPPPLVEVGLLARKGSLTLTRPLLFDYISTRSELLATAADLFDILRGKRVQIQVGQRYALKDAGEAHLALESRKTAGATILVV